MLIFLNLTGQSLCNQAAKIQHVDPVGNVHDQVHVVLDEQDGQMVFVPNFMDKVRQFQGLLRIHPGSRFIQQQEFGFRSQGPGNFQTPLEAVRQACGQSVSVLPQSLLPQQSLGFLPHAGLFLAADPEGGRKYIVLGPHVLGDNHIVKTLLIMAAGIGSRFGTGIKQLEPVDASNRIIMDYSIHDAIEAGFNHVVFIIRKDIEKEFKEVIGDRIAAICADHQVTVDYAFQDSNDIPGTLPEGRTKPWGTGQAVLAAKNILSTPFIVINADDYYGKEGFRAVHEYLVNGGKSCMAGFVLKNTLSDNGGVTRGICKMDEQNNLTEVVETKNIVKTATGAEADGVAVDVNSLVSMNMWGLTPDFLTTLGDGFQEFFEKEVPGNPLKAEFLIPIFIGEQLEQGKMSVKVLKTNDTWYGMTYHEDVAAVKDSFKKMLENGVYKADLFCDL